MMITRRDFVTRQDNYYDLRKRLSREKLPWSPERAGALVSPSHSGWPSLAPISAVCARDAHRLASAAERTRTRGNQSSGHCQRIWPNPREIKSFVARVEQSLGPVDILINNAGVGYFAPGTRCHRGKLGRSVRHQLESGVPAEQSRSEGNDPAQDAATSSILRHLRARMRLPEEQFIAPRSGACWG